MTLVPLLLIANACSKDDSGEQGVEHAGSDAVATLFAQGFADAGASPAAASNEASAVGEPDPRTGIPFKRSSTLTSRVESSLAESLGKDFTLDYAIKDPGAFLRSRKVREIYARELAARRYPEDTVAGATALLFSVAWELVNGEALSPAQNAAILRQLNAKLRGDDLERVDDEQRQIQADLRLLTAGLWLEEAYVRGPFPEQMRELSEAVQRDMQKISNNDMRAYLVTAEGFVDR